jgi:hypothetical protein
MCHKFFFSFDGKTWLRILNLNFRKNILLAILGQEVVKYLLLYPFPTIWYYWEF